MSVELTAYQAQHGDFPGEALTIKDSLEEFQIATTADATYMGQILAECTARIKVVEKERKEIADPQNKAWKATNAFFKKFRKPWEEAQKVAKYKLTDWEREQARRAAEDAAKSREAAEKALLAREAAKYTKTQQEALEAAALEKDAAPAIAEQVEALKAEVAQQEAVAQESFDEAREALVSSVVQDEAVKTVSKRSNWKHRVTDFKALVLAVADSVRAGDEVALDLLLPNGPVLTAIAKDYKTEREIFNGVESWDDFTIIGRA